MFHWFRAVVDDQDQTKVVAAETYHGKANSEEEGAIDAHVPPSSNCFKQF